MLSQSRHGCLKCDLIVAIFFFKYMFCRSRHILQKQGVKHFKQDLYFSKNSTHLVNWRILNYRTEHFHVMSYRGKVKGHSHTWACERVCRAGTSGHCQRTRMSRAGGRPLAPCRDRCQWPPSAVPSRRSRLGNGSAVSTQTGSQRAPLKGGKYEFTTDGQRGE